MSDERTLAILRAAERLGVRALTWLPFPDECAEHVMADRDSDQILIERDLHFIRSVLKETEFAILNVAEHAGSKGF